MTFYGTTTVYVLKRKFHLLSKFAIFSVLKMAHRQDYHVPVDCPSWDRRLCWLDALVRWLAGWSQLVHRHSRTFSITITFNGFLSNFIYTYFFHSNSNFSQYFSHRIGHSHRKKHLQKYFLATKSTVKQTIKPTTPECLPPNWLRDGINWMSKMSKSFIGSLNRANWGCDNRQMISQLTSPNLLYQINTFSAFCLTRHKRATHTVTFIKNAT
jgi:hypothetical protein